MFVLEGETEMVMLSRRVQHNGGSRKTRTGLRVEH